jgi:hypothetical protein
VEKLEDILKSVHKAFRIAPEVNLSEGLAPGVFMERQATIISADKELDELLVR